MERRFCSYQHSEFSFLTGGSGRNALVCFHGFGETAHSFSFLEHGLGNEFTIYAPELPWHGETRWMGSFNFTVNDLIELLKQMIPGFHNQKIYLLGFSMGGRICLSLLEHIPGKIEKAVLLAPDGLTVSNWYRLATQTKPGNALFRFTMQHPHWFATLVNSMNKVKLVNTSVAKYVHKYIDDKQKREDLYRIWTTMRKFRPDLKKVKQNLSAHQIMLHLVFGSYDRIIPAASGYRLQQNGEQHIKVHELNAGHLLLKEKHAAFIISLLNNE